MPRYIDADKAKEILGTVRCAYNCFDDNERTHYEVLSKTIEMINEMPTADVVSKEDTINELIKEISDRITQFLEENYEIIPKKPQVRCKDCRFWRGKYCSDFLTVDENGFCSWAERMDDGGTK